MPVTARLSKAFYDQFGEQVTNELVEWFNAVDLTYRHDLRTLNDTNFARFAAVLEARFAQAEAREERRLRERLAELETRLDQRFVRVEDAIRDTRESLQAGLLGQLRWMIGLWMTSTVGILAVLVTLLRQGG